MKHDDLLLMQVFAQILYRHAEIVSGAYKLPSRLTCSPGQLRGQDHAPGRRPRRAP